VDSDQNSLSWLLLFLLLEHENHEKNLGGDGKYVVITYLRKIMVNQGVGSESIQRFIEEPAFLPSYDLVPVPQLPPHLSRK